MQLSKAEIRALRLPGLGHTLFSIVAIIEVGSAIASSPSIEQLEPRAASSYPLVITNNCSQTIWPGIVSEAGTGPDVGGFELAVGSKRNLSVGLDWQGRVWGRTNCSFNANGTGPSNTSSSTACLTGDCGGLLNCKSNVRYPIDSLFCCGSYCGY